MTNPIPLFPLLDDDPALDEIKWDAQLRLEEIERWLYWQGSLSRSELAEKFRMSKQQTSAILKQYQQLHPTKIWLNGSTKRYMPNDDVANRFYQPSIDDLLMQSENLGVPFNYVSVPSRRMPLDVMRDISRAIYQFKSIEITYHSQKDPAGKTRRISPHRFVQTSKRLHVRAWCHESQGYRDFIVGRISATGEMALMEQSANEDEAWHHMISLMLKPNPRLSKAQKQLIELDFEMTQGIRTLEVRQALLPYYFELYTLWPDYQIDNPLYQPVILANNADVLKFL